MELGLSLGDASKTVEFSREGKSTDQDQKPTKMSGLDFCMALGLSRSSPENEIDDLQLNLLPVNPVRPIKSHLQSLPWSSDNGSSENGSSTAAAAAARVLDVNRPSLAVEEVSSTNSVGSPPLIHMDIGIMYRSDYSVYRGSNKRSLSTDFNNSVEDDEDEENGINARSKKLRLSKQQSAFLEQSFKEQSTLNPKQKLALAKQLNLRPRQVEVWFQNRRARTKLKQTEVDCEYLKRCCETLTEENRRLHKELQELRALKTSDPFHMQLPATTLTMCPSCERVNTASTDTVPFPQTRPRVYPFSKASTHSPS